MSIVKNNLQRNGDFLNFSKSAICHSNFNLLISLFFLKHSKRESSRLSANIFGYNVQIVVFIRPIV